MSLLKELLFLVITMMHMSLLASQPVKVTSGERNLDETTEIKTMLRFVLKNLEKAESAFVKNFNINNLHMEKGRESLTGMTSPAGNSNTLYSLCAIDNNLRKHLPLILTNLTSKRAEKEEILNNTAVFNNFYESLGTRTECPRNLPDYRTLPNDYKKKLYAYQILHAAVNWTEMYTKVSLP